MSSHTTIPIQRAAACPACRSTSTQTEGQQAETAIRRQWVLVMPMTVFPPENPGPSVPQEDEEEEEEDISSIDILASDSNSDISDLS